MNDLKIYRWAGACGLAAIILFLVEFPIYFLRGPVPPLADTNKLSDYIAKNTGNVLTVVLLDMLIYCGFLVFLAGFRHLIRQARPEYEWLSTLVFGVGLVYTTLTLVADSLEGASALDALAGKADSSAIRALTEGQFLMFGSVALILMALLLVSGGYTIVASGALPKWSDWVGYAGGVLCLAFIPSMFTGVPDPNGFYNPAGWGPLGVVAGFPLGAWAVIVSIMMLRKRETLVSMPVRFG
jgi:hypothetical protein